jgi:formylglycine-generating enzyme required for sulfatase activity
VTLILGDSARAASRHLAPLSRTVLTTFSLSQFAEPQPDVKTFAFTAPYIVSIRVLGIALFLCLSAQLDFSDSAFGAKKFGAKKDDKGCPVNMVRVGPLCMDKYETTVWSEPPNSNGTPRGKQFGLHGEEYCAVNGDDCTGIFAVSLPGRIPAASITWFQAQQACLNVGKRLPTNAEWQGAAAGTPTHYELGADDGVNDCNTSTAGTVVPTGSRSNCVSNFGAFDMVGNLIEWTADWVQGNSTPFDPPDGFAGEDFGNDFMRGTNPATAQGFGTNFPSAISRGGGFKAGLFSPNGSGAGVFSLNARFAPTDFGDDSGFRCVR